jgi:hypothetical protein
MHKQTIKFAAAITRSRYPASEARVGRAIAQTVSRRLPTAAARVRAQVKSCGICGGQNDTGTGFLQVLTFPRRSQWRRGLRHEPSSPARTLGSRVRVPLQAWMFVCAFILCWLVFRVYVAALRRAHPPSKESYRLCMD